MIERDGIAGDEDLARRTARYRTLAAIESSAARTILVRSYQDHLAALRRGGDAMATRGAQRLLGYAALDLAITPCPDRRAASAKDVVLGGAKASLDGPAADAHLGRIGAMIAAAAAAERLRWSTLMAVDAERRTGHARKTVFVDAAQRRRYVTMSEPLALAEAIYDVAKVVHDHAALSVGADHIAAAGAAHAIRYAAGYCMAVPAESLQDLRAKVSMLTIVHDALVPARLFRPVFETALASDRELVGGSAVEVAHALDVLIGGD